MNNPGVVLENEFGNTIRFYGDNCYELIKLLKRGKTWIVFCLFAAVIGVTIFAQFKQDKNIRKWNSPEKQLQIAQDELEYTNNELKNIDELRFIFTSRAFNLLCFSCGE